MAGVDIEAGNEAVRRIKRAVQKTFSPCVLTDIGSFGALYDLKTLIQTYKHPVLVQSIDGVGTKTMIARMMNQYHTIGIDVVSATANDIVVLGATPLTLLDYIASDKLNPNVVEQIIQGMSAACAENGIALIGGETAEMPGVYNNSENDIVAVVTGVVDKEQVILGKDIVASDVILGLHSSGLHTNGYSLARKLLFEVAHFTVDSAHPELSRTIGETLLEPHLNYTRPILHLLQQSIPIAGMAHITGGGFIDNIPRILPQGCGVEIDRASWEIPALFYILQQLGNLSIDDLFRTFNMGIGLVMIVQEAYVDIVFQSMQNWPAFQISQIGRVVRSEQKLVRIL